LRDRGLVAPGYLADLLLLNDLEACAVATVIRRGRVVTEESFTTRILPAAPAHNSVYLSPVAAAAFGVPASGPGTPVIEIIPGKIITAREYAEMPFRGGQRHADPSRDLLKVCVLERHGRNGNIGRGFVRGFGLQAGALASSVGHDSHNLCVVGTNDSDMATAANRLISLGGGFVAVRDGAVLAEMALPVAGLMSLHPFEDVAHNLEHLRAAEREMGCSLAEPFLQLAFLALPVIPHLKITDMGLVDVDRFELIAA
jgi:adenine deaminase